MIHAPILVTMFLALCIAHFLADFPLQGQFLSDAKNPTAPIPGVPWWIGMSAHCAIQAGFVWLITGSLLCGFGEFTVHFAVDFGKCRGEMSFAQDQFFHLFFKFMWVLLAFDLAATGLVQ